MAPPVCDEDFPSRRHHGHIIRKLQRTRGACQLPYPRAIRGPQHHHTMVVLICHEEEGLVGGEGQASGRAELTRFIALRPDDTLPFALHLKGGM